MRLEQRIEHECNRLLCPKGALGLGDTTETRINSLIFLYRLELIDESTFAKVSRAIDSIDFEDQKESLASSILEDAKVKTVMKLEISLPNGKTLKKNVKREYNFLLIDARIFGHEDDAFTRIIYLNILYRLQLIDYDSYDHVVKVTMHMDYTFKEKDEKK